MGNTVGELQGYTPPVSSSDDTTSSAATKSGNTLDKNAFLKILISEMKNQLPDSTQDPTQFVAQLAQFSSLEQMENMNTTASFNSLTSIIGKKVNLNSLDSNGNQYSGMVTSVTKKGDNMTVNVKLSSGEIKPFSYSDIQDVVDAVDGRINYIESDTGFLMASSLIGKTADISSKDSKGNTSTVTGVIKEVYRDDKGIEVKVSVSSDGKTTEEDFPYEDITSLKES